MYNYKLSHPSYGKLPTYSTNSFSSIPHATETYTPLPVLRAMTVLTPLSELKPLNPLNIAFIDYAHTPDSSFDDSFLFDNSHLVSSSVESVPPVMPVMSSPIVSQPNVPPVSPNSLLPSSYEANSQSSS